MCLFLVLSFKYLLNSRCRSFVKRPYIKAYVLSEIKQRVCEKCHLSVITAICGYINYKHLYKVFNEPTP